MAEFDVPDVNGFHPDWSSISMSVLGRSIQPLVKEIKYLTKVEAQDIYGAKRKVVGTTQGREKHDQVSITFWRRGYIMFIADLKAAAGGSFKKGMSGQFFSTTVSYQDSADQLHTDELIGMRLVEQNAGGSDGTDGLTKECKFTVMRIKYDGDEMVVEDSP